jgi:glutamate 5-kinase
LINSIYDSTEAAIQKMTEATQKMRDMSSTEGMQVGYGGMIAAIKRYLKREIKTMRNTKKRGRCIFLLILYVCFWTLGGLLSTAAVWQQC